MTPAQYHLDRVAQCGCAVCRRQGAGWVPGHIHHVAEGSGKRSDFATVCLCPYHHDGLGGFHRLHDTFLKLHRVPWEREEGLLAWAAEDLTLLAMNRLPLAVA